jgi:hypothetical protein
MIPKRNRWITDALKIQILTWSGKKEDEDDLRAFCGDQLQYVREDGIAAIGESGGFVTEYYAGEGDFIVADADSARPVIKLPGDHWLMQELFGPHPVQEQSESESEQPSA